MTQKLVGLRQEQFSREGRGLQGSMVVEDAAVCVFNWNCSDILMEAEWRQRGGGTLKPIDQRSDALHQAAQCAVT